MVGRETGPGRMGGQGRNRERGEREREGNVRTKRERVSTSLQPRWTGAVVLE